MAIIASLIMLFLLGAPGVRLLASAARERRAPEFWCGLFFVGAAFGISARFFAIGFRFTDPDGVMLIDNAAHVALSIGLTALVVFVLHVFHPESTGARAFGTAVVITGIATTAYAVWERATIGEQPATIIVTNSFRALPLAWVFFESVRYWRNMKRRAALGLADPVVLNRFMLWSVWTGGVTLVPVLALGLRVAILAIYGTEGLENGQVEAILPRLLMVMRGVMMLVLPTVMVSLWLSFFPPQRYLDRVRTRAGAASIG